MKREGYLFNKICSIDNLILAEKKARRGKSKQSGVKEFDLDSENKLIHLHHLLVNKEFITSEYNIFSLFEKKVRIISELPYYPDRIVHHAIINIIGDIFIKSFTKDTYSCLKNRGIHKCLNNLNKALKNKEETKYCLKLDIKKYFPSINHDILKDFINNKIKDENVLQLLYGIIDSNKLGIPLGNYTSQLFGNIYSNSLLHYLKEELKIKYLFLYCDDLVILGSNKDELRVILNKIRIYLDINLKLSLSNYQIFPVKSRGIDFLGYVSYHDCIYLRKSIKNDYIKMMKYYPNKKSKASYNGWLLACNSVNLRNKYEK